MLPNSDSFWLPFTDNRAFKADPRLLVKAQDMHYYAADGRAVLDATAGLWCVNAGHGRPRIVEAIRKQAGEMDYAPSFNISHPLPFELAARVSALLPAGLGHVFFAGSGSESVETALKIALAYHRARKEGGRTRLIGRERGYHGVNFGGLSVGGLSSNRRVFPSLPAVDHLPHTHNPATPFIRGQAEQGAHLADVLENLVALHGVDTIAAVIVEPMAGSTGVLPPPKGYLERLREITRKYGILLIFDEVITGFGRLGAATAAERFGVVPDIMTLAKGLTNGAVPMGAAVASTEVHDSIMNDCPGGIELFHGYTYSAHPLAAAAGLATLDVYQEEGIFAHVASLEAHFEDVMHAMADLPHVKDVRNLGLAGAIELESRPGAPGARAMEAFHRCFDAGMLIRVTGDTIAISPPLIVSRAQIDEIGERLRDVLSRLA